MRLQTLFAFITSVLFSAEIDAQQNEYWRQHAEYEPTEAVWIIYPQIIHKRGFPNEKVIAEMMRAIAPYATIKLVVRNDEMLQKAKTNFGAGYFEKGTIIPMQLDYQEFWARDIGPVFVTNEKGDKAVADFMFNVWGYGDTADAAARLDEKLDEHIAAHYKIPVLSTFIASEGGDREINSSGVLLLVEAVEKQRNPSLSLQQMEPEYKRLLGAKKIIWLKQGVRDDDMSTQKPLIANNGKAYYTLLTTGGHVDEFARFVNDSTILLADVDVDERTDVLEKETGERMDENYKILSNATNADGKPFHIIRMPTPYPVVATMQPGDSVYAQLRDLQMGAGNEFPAGGPVNGYAAASYLNFLIVNKAVLVAKYWKKGMPKKVKQRDAEAVRILQDTFPGKHIIPIDALAVNMGGGGMHCISMNEPMSTK